MENMTVASAQIQGGYLPRALGDQAGVGHLGAEQAKRIGEIEVQMQLLSTAIMDLGRVISSVPERLAKVSRPAPKAGEVSNTTSALNQAGAPGTEFGRALQSAAHSLQSQRAALTEALARLEL